MKCGIITYYWSKNIGALIQSISLLSFLKNNFKDHTFSFENYLPKELIVRENQNQTKTYNFIKWIKAKRKNIYLNNWKKNIAKLPLPKVSHEKYEKDFYIYGSDEIWNYENPFFKYDSFFFGKNNFFKKIAYAVSIGNLNFKENSLPEEIKKNINSFNNISVRDEKTFEFVKIITKKKPFIACDPSLLITPELISGDYSSKYNFYKNEKFILVYGVYFSKNQIIRIKRYASSRKLKIFSVSYYNIWADKNLLSVNPNDFIYLLKNSESIFTSMFHGIILSYKFNKNFWYTLDPYRENKINFFLKKFNLKNRLVDFLSNKEFNYNENKSKFEDWVKESKNEILKNIN